MHPHGPRRPQRAPLRRSSHRGVALLTALFFCILCFGLATAFLIQLPVDLGSTASIQRNTEGFYVADAGIQATLAWMSGQLGQGVEPCTVSTVEPVRTGSLGPWTWECRVVPDESTPPHALTDLRVYTLTSTAYRDSHPFYRIETTVQGGQTFARFSMYTDRDDPMLWDYAVSQHSDIRGPIHKNSPIRFLVTGDFFAGGDLGHRPFNGTVSTSGSDNIWSTTPSSSQLDLIFENGLSDLEFGVPPRPLPGDSSILANAAWGGSTPATPPNGVSVNPSGGVFIEGDVDHMELGVNGAGRFVLTVRIGSEITTVVEDPTADSRTVTHPDGTVETVAGVGNGTIFTTGDIRSLRGENRGAHTIANAFDAGKTIEITGSLTRRDTSLGQEPEGTDDRLGIVSEYIYIADHATLPRSLSTPLHIYATMLATERLEVRHFNSGPPGAMAIYGGLSSGSTWMVRMSNNANGQTLSGYGGQSGFGSIKIVYDALLANEPPPEYPSTAGTELTVRSWREQPL